MNDEIAYRVCLGDDLAAAVLRGELRLAKKLVRELRKLLEAEAGEAEWRGSLDTLAIPVSDAEDLALAWKHVFREVDHHEQREKVAAFLASLGPKYRRDVKEASSRLTEWGGHGWRA